jgi:hypothetical protein
LLASQRQLPRRARVPQAEVRLLARAAVADHLDVAVVVDVDAEDVVVVQVAMM